VVSTLLNKTSKSKHYSSKVCAFGNFSFSVYVHKLFAFAIGSVHVACMQQARRQTYSYVLLCMYVMYLYNMAALRRTGHFPCNFPPQCTPTWLASLNMSTMDFRVITSSNICSQQTYHHCRPSSHMHRMVLALKLTAASPHTHTHVYVCMYAATHAHTHTTYIGFIIQARGNKKSLLAAAGCGAHCPHTYCIIRPMDAQAYLHFLISLAKLL
jgi:hypothetical protein